MPRSLLRSVVWLAPFLAFTTRPVCTARRKKSAERGRRYCLKQATSIEPPLRAQMRALARAVAPLVRYGMYISASLVFARRTVHARGLPTPPRDGEQAHASPVRLATTAPVLPTTRSQRRGPPAILCPYYISDDSDLPAN